LPSFQVARQVSSSTAGAPAPKRKEARRKEGRMFVLSSGRVQKGDESLAPAEEAVLTRTLGALDIGTGLEAQQEAALLRAALNVGHRRLALPMPAIVREDEGSCERYGCRSPLAKSLKCPKFLSGLGQPTHP